MPVTIAKEKSPKGHEYLRLHSFGEVTGADAEELIKTIAPNEQNASLAILATVDPGAKFSPEARQVFTRNKPRGDAKPVGVVVTSAPLRVLLSFIIRISGASKHTRFFANEPDALAFIENQLLSAAA